MNCFAPSITHSPSSRRARVRVLPASEPASGSVSPKAASRRPRAQLRQPLGLLLVGAPEVDRHRPQRRVRGHRDADRGVDARELLDRERVGERVGAAAAVLLRERDAHQAELAQLARRSRRGTHLVRSSSSATGATSCAREVAHGVAQQPLLVGEVEVHSSAQSLWRAGPTKQPHAEPGRAVADVLAAHVPGGAGDVQVRPRACRRRTPPGTRPRRSTMPCACSSVGEVGVRCRGSGPCTRGEAAAARRARPFARPASSTRSAHSSSFANRPA